MDKENIFKKQRSLKYFKIRTELLPKHNNWNHY